MLNDGAPNVGAAWTQDAFSQCMACYNSLLYIPVIDYYYIFLSDGEIQSIDVACVTLMVPCLISNWMSSD